MDSVYLVKKVTHPKDIHAIVPGSKSITNRALLLSAMSSGKSVVHNVLFSDDSRVFMQALIDLGFDVQIDEANREVIIYGCGGKIPKPEAEIYVGSAGTAARFLTALLGLSKGRYRITSSEQMKKRPMKELLDALTAIGSEVEYEEEPYHFPFVIGLGNKFASETTVNIDKSSQFLSALLISSLLLPDNFKIKIEGTHGMRYVDMTLKMMENYGSPLFKINNGVIVTSNQFDYAMPEYFIEPDLSAAAYFYAMGAVLGVKAKVENVFFDSMQGDIEFLRVLEKMGCTLTEETDGILLCGPKDGLNGGAFDLSAFSDQALTLAAVSVFAKQPVMIKNIGHIRFQECDRINAIISNLKKMGISAVEENGDITIFPGECEMASIETYEDHRVAMSFAICGTKVDGIEIINPMCCKKTFETYFDCLEKYIY